jgi:STAM-binding protein
MAISRHHASLTRPQSVKEVAAQAEDFTFTIHQPIQRWIRAARLLLTEAAICEQDGNLQMAYLYLYRHAQLVLDRLPKHPDYADSRYRGDLLACRKDVERNLVKLEQWKPRISQDYQRYIKALERRTAERQRVLEQQRRDDEEINSRRQSIASSEDGSVYGDGSRHLLANEHRELAVDLAHREIRRRDATRQSTRQAGISPGTVASRRKGIVVEQQQQQSQPEDEAGQSDGVREVGRQLYERPPVTGADADRRSMTTQQSSAYHYPTVPAREETIDWKMPAMQPQRPPKIAAAAIPPLRPAKESISKTLYPSHQPQQSAPAPALPPKRHHTPPPASPSPPPLPSKYTFTPTSTTEAGVPLRTLFLPPNLPGTFLSLARPNTIRDLETCGILCGTLISNALFLTHLIIPDQTATANTCDTTPTGDAALFSYCDENNLLVLGWIHTHPSQSCFLSSRDLHTSAGYQVMLPEAIAIVCAPREGETGVFRLTDPPGLPAVLECKKPGLFHPHEERNLYTDALRPGHVVEAPGLEWRVVDLRGEGEG